MFYPSDDKPVFMEKLSEPIEKQPILNEDILLPLLPQASKRNKRPTASFSDLKNTKKK